MTFNVAQLNSDRTQALVSFPYSPNAGQDKWSPDIPKFLYQFLELQLTGTLQKSGASTGKGTAAPLGPLALIPNIEFAVGGKVIKKISANSLCTVGGPIFRGMECQITPASEMLTADNGDEDFAFSIYLDFQRPRTHLPSGPRNPNELTGPELTYLRSQDWDNASMHIDWKDHRSLIYGATGYTTFQIINCKLDVIGHIDERPVMNDPRQQGYMLHKFLPKRVSTPATSPLMETKLPAGARDSYSGILLFQATDDGAGALLPEDTIIPANGKIQVWINNGSQKIFDSTWSRLRSMNMVDYQTPLKKGFAFIDPLRTTKQYQSAWRADKLAGVESIELLTDVVGKTNGYIQFDLQSLEPPQ